MNVSVFGLGYVGAVTGACLAKSGHIVIGVDVKEEKVNAINNGKAPVLEKGLSNIISEVVAEGKLKATTNPEEAIVASEVSLICVGTPSNVDGSLNLDYVKKVCCEIGDVLKSTDGFHTVVIRSTVLPGTTRNEVIPILHKRSMKQLSKDFSVCVNPEFMREGEGVHDFLNPERIVIGEVDKKGGNVVERLYCSLTAPIVRTDIEVAEMIKYVDNSFHGAKVAFANEIGSICEKIGIDGRDVMSIFCMDKKLNLAPYYFMPGFAFGGSCIPKDLRALITKSRELNIECPLLQAVDHSNQKHIDRGLEMIISQNKRRIGVFGLSFKSGTDDTRESPIISLITKLLGKGNLKLFEKGYSVSIYDPNIRQSDIENILPHIAPLLKDSIEEVIERSDVLVIANKNKKFEEILDRMRNGQILIDFVGIVKGKKVKDGRYIGICW